MSSPSLSAVRAAARDVDVAYPAGEPLVQLTAGRFFFAPRPGVTQSMEPAGSTQALVCLRCDVTLWPTLL